MSYTIQENGKNPNPESHVKKESPLGQNTPGQGDEGHRVLKFIHSYVTPSYYSGVYRTLDQYVHRTGGFYWAEGNLL